MNFTRMFILSAFVLLTALSWAETIEVGTHESYNAFLPISTQWGYSYTQLIYPRTLINREGEITAIGFYYEYSMAGGNLAHSNQWDVYLGHTDKNSFANASDYIPVSSLDPVFSGYLPAEPASGWIMIPLDTPFPYNNLQNLVVAIDENTPGIDQNAYWGVYTDGPRALTMENGIDILPSNPYGYNEVVYFMNCWLRLSFGEETLPVELSAFNATVTADNLVRLDWVSQSEANMSGYYVFRSELEDLSGASVISPLIPATNTSSEHNYSYTDLDLYAGGTYHYWLQSLDLDGMCGYHGPVSVLVDGEPGDPGIPPLLPNANELLPAYPNPFNPNTNIHFVLKDASSVKIEISNAKGQLIRIFEHSYSEPGYYKIMWDGKDASGNEAASGVYLYRMTAGTYSASRKMVLAK